MNALELLDIINAGETSRVQFKEKFNIPDDIAEELVAMSNSLGGIILIGVRDETGEIIGLNYREVQKTQNLFSDVATNNIIPMIYIETESVSVEIDDEKRNILVIHVKEGAYKPYKDRKQRIFTKQGADNRKVTDNFEILRLFQQGGNLLADEMEVPNTNIDDINERYFREYINKEFNSTIEELGLTFEQIVINKNILRNRRLTLGGLLFFCKSPQRYKPIFCIKAVSFFGNDIGGTQYRDSEDIGGTIPEMFNKGMAFFNRNLKKIQMDQNVNSEGILEVSQIALEEVLQNALVHREYLKNASIRLLIFDNRIELISPGKLPNNLTVDNIKVGNSAIRNHLLASYCVNTLPYRGLGSGIKRSIKEQPNIEFINDVDGEQFIVIIPRPEQK